MPGWAVGDMMEVRIMYMLNEQVCMNVLHYANTLGSSGDYETVIDAFDFAINGGTTTLYDSIKAHTSEDLTIFRVDYQKVRSSREYIVSKTYDLVGTIAAVSLPPANCAQITKRGTITGKGRTGHFALPGISVGDVTDGELTAAFQAAVTLEIASALDDTLVAGTCTFEPTIGPDQVVGVYNFIRTAVVQREVRTQKRRVVRRGI